MNDHQLPALAAKPPKPGRGRPKAIGAQLARALDAMVWQGLDRKAAADHAGMLDKSLYNALRKRHVKSHYLAELETLRASERARNIHRLCEIRDNSQNDMASVGAIKVLEGDTTTRNNVNVNVGLSGEQAGFVIDLSEPGDITIRPERERPHLDDRIIELTPNSQDDE